MCRHKSGATRHKLASFTQIPVGFLLVVIGGRSWLEARRVFIFESLVQGTQDLYTLSR